MCGEHAWAHGSSLLVLVEPYQLMKELFPAEWFPITMTITLRLGGRSVTPTSRPNVMRPAAETGVRSVGEDVQAEGLDLGCGTSHMWRWGKVSEEDEEGKVRGD